VRSINIDSVVGRNDIWMRLNVLYSLAALALRYADSLQSNQFSAEERNVPGQALCRLGCSRVLRRKFLWIRTPLSPLIQLPLTPRAFATGACKKVLFHTAR
jgi:hypothetical protein